MSAKLTVTYAADAAQVVDTATKIGEQYSRVYSFTAPENTPTDQLRDIETQAANTFLSAEVNVVGYMISWTS